MKIKDKITPYNWIQGDWPRIAMVMKLISMMKRLVDFVWWDGLCIVIR